MRPQNKQFQKRMQAKETELKLHQNGSADDARIANR